MKQFSELAIPTRKSFTGSSIQIESVLDKKIIVNDFRIQDSTKKEGTKCLWLQVTVDNTKHVIFSGSTILMDQLIMVKEDDFPFETTLVKINRHYEFK